MSARKKTKKQQADELNASAAAGPQAKLYNEVQAAPRTGRTRASQIVSHPVDWIVDRWVAEGEVSLLGGPSEVGKSTFLAAVVAQVTGGPPVERHGRRVPRNALWCTAEESVANAVGPRLVTAGALLDHVVYPCHDECGYLRDRLALPADWRRLQAIIMEERAQVLVLDPISSFLDADTNPFDGVKVRRLIETLSSVSLETSCSVIFTLHDRKSQDGPTISHFAGSAAWTQTPRTVIRLGKDAVAPDRYVMCSEKGQVAGKPRSRYYTLPRAGIFPAYVLGVECDVQANDLDETPSGLVEKSAVEEARDWLRQVLDLGPQKATVLQQLANSDGMSWSAIKRAYYLLRPKLIRHAENGTWYSEWSRPNDGWAT
jgi:AAA domain